MKLILAAALVVFSALSVANAQGFDPRYPYCVLGKVGMFGSYDCTYYTLEQCRMSASPDGYCQRNPGYQGPSRPYRGYR